MIDKRLGEHLWSEWSGEGLDSLGLYYFTPEHVDLEEELVRRALASMLQRDGVVDSLFEGFKSIAETEIIIGWIGHLDGEKEYYACTEDGETFYGESVTEVYPCTWVEINY